MKNLIDKSELISKLQTLEGLTNDERSSLIGLLREHKKYGLVWEDKPEDVEERLRESLPVLREVKDKAILSDESDAPNHILIEGDNLEALTALSYTHEGRIDVIYIDPPYNTGNKDFVYNDSFVDSEDSYRHSKWLSFMSKRLKIAKKLLSDKGVIFISIDDNEQAQLKLLCDEVFTAANHINTITINMNSLSGVKMTHAINGKRYPAQKEYLLLYSKGADKPVLKIEKVHKKTWDKEYNLIIPQMSSQIYELFDKITDQEANKILSSMQIISLPVYMKEKGIKDTEEWKWANAYRIFGSKSNRPLANRCRKLEFDQEIVCYTNSDGNKRFFLGQFNREARDPRIELVQAESNSSYFLSDNWIDISNDGGVGQEGGVIFPNGKKPLQLIERILNSINNRDAIVLDFFAGSGTTGHAVLQLNDKDQGHRHFILVTNNENKICEEKTYMRCKNVIHGYGNYEGLSNNTLRYYKTDYISRERTQKNMRDLVAAATDLLCIKEDLYEEQQTFGRFKLKPQLARYFDDGRKHMLIIYREELIDEIAEEIKNLDFGGKCLKIYVFSPGRYPFTDNFSEVEDKVELVALPAAIYDAYQRVLPKRKEKLFAEATEKQETIIPADLFEGQGA